MGTGGRRGGGGRPAAGAGGQPDLEKYLAAALDAVGDYADLYFEYLTSTSLTLDESY